MSDLLEQLEVRRSPDALGLRAETSASELLWLLVVALSGLAASACVLASPEFLDVLQRL